MARAAGFNNAFNAGELEEGAWSRSDLAQHAHGLALGLNLVGTVAGPAVRAPGTWFIDLTKVQAEASVLVPFARDPDDAQILELGDGYFRVFYADGSPVMDGPDRYEVAHGFGEADLAKLSFQQNGDVIAITHRDGLKTRRIKRLAPDIWEFGDYVFENGPWRAENLDRAFTITVTGTSTVCTEDPDVGSIAEGQVVTLAASADLFIDPGHVGSLWRLRQNDGNHGSESWTPRPDVKQGQFVLSAGRIYQRQQPDDGPQSAADTGGLTQPIHESGVVSDGRYNFVFMNDGAGVVEITAIASPTSATGVVKRPIPLKTGQATSYWAEGAFSDLRGYPTAKPAVREERFVFAATPSEPDKLFGSRTAGFTADKVDMTPGLGTGLVVDSDALNRFAGDEPGKIMWLISLPFLIAGKSSAPVLITGSTIEEPLAPASNVARDLNSFGSSAVAPVRAGGAGLYVQRGGGTLRELVVNPDKGLGTRDLSVVAGHLGKRGFAQLCWQGTQNLCWIRLADGGLAALVYHEEQNVYGFTRRVLAAGVDDEEAGAWSVESLACLPGEADTVWMIASRVKGEARQRAILMMAQRSEGCFWDAAELYEGAAVGVVGGLEHLEGETVCAMAGPAVGPPAQYRNLTVTGGAVTLPNDVTAERIWVGLSYMSRFRSLPLDLGGPGATQGSRTRISQGVVIVRGADAVVRTEDDQGGEQCAVRLASEVSAPRPRRHSAKVTFGGNTDRDVRVVVETTGGWDLSIQAIKAWGGANA